MDRRNFLILCAGVLAAGWELEGCGGGSSQSAASLQTTRGLVKLPPGSSLSPTKLSLSNAFDAHALAADGSFQIHTQQGAPVLVLLSDDSGRAVMCGFVDPQASANVLDAQAQAVALLYMVAGGYTIPVDHKRDLLNLIASDASVGPLAGAIAARISANPHALEDGDPQIGDALKTAFATITGGRATAAASRAASATFVVATGPAAGKGGVRLVGAPRRDVNIPLQLLVQPSTQQSGIEVVQDSGSTGLVVTNHFRRRCQVLVYATGTEDANGKRADYPTAQLQGKPVDLGSTTALSIFSTLENLFSGQTAFVPVSTPVIPLTMAQGATKTFFDVIVLGSASNDKGEPAFFSDPKYAGEVAGWRTTRKNLNLKSLLIDLTLGVLVEALGFLFVVPTDTGVQAAIDGLNKVSDPRVAALLARAAGGDAFDIAAWTDFYRLWLEELLRDDLIGLKTRAALYEMLTIAEKQAALETGQALTRRTLLLTLKMLNAAVGIAGLILGAGDIGAVIHDLSTADEADIWNATLFKPTLLLAPTPANIAPGARQTFTVKVPAGTSGTIVYDWSTAATFAILSDNAGHAGKTIETNSANVDLVTTPSDQGTITVAVTAYLQGPQGGRQKIGDATATVTLASNTGVTTLQPTNIMVLAAPAPAGSGSASRAAYGFYTFAAQQGASYYELDYVNAGGIQGSLGGRLYQSDYLAGAPPIDTNTDRSHWVAYGASGMSSGQFFNLGGKAIGYLALAEPFDPSIYSEAQAVADVQNNLNKQPQVEVAITT